MYHSGALILKQEKMLLPLFEKMNKKNSTLEKFFISSPIGSLEICMRQHKLYSISKLQQRNLKKLINESKIKINSYQMIDKNTSYIIDFRSQSIIKKQPLSSFAQSSQSQLNHYFKGKLKKFNIPLFTRGTRFQKRLWKILQTIPWGETQFYSQLAKKMNIPKGARAVGNGCAANPFLIVVPCHRVLSKQGWGGFTLGLKAKKQLLFLEKT